jgi:hypothetical protein
MNKLNQTEPATFSILPCWAFFRDSYFLYFIAISALFAPGGGCKKSTRTFNKWGNISDPSTRHYCCACGNLVLSIRLFSCWVVPENCQEIFQSNTCPQTKKGLLLPAIGDAVRNAFFVLGTLNVFMLKVFYRVTIDSVTNETDNSAKYHDLGTFGEIKDKQQLVMSLSILLVRYISHFSNMCVQLTLSNLHFLTKHQ